MSGHEFGEELFPDFDFEAARVPPPEPVEKLSADRRRTIRQHEALKIGQHPLALAKQAALALHPEAPPVDDRDAPGPRCGTCVFRRHVHGGAKAYPKCLRGWDGDRRREPPWASHGSATDVRSWWPGCRFWEPIPESTDPSPDGLAKTSPGGAGPLTPQTSSRSFPCNP